MENKNSLKVIGQFIAALVYTPIYTAVLYLVVVFSMAWILTLPWWAILLICFLGGVAIMKFLNMFALAPFYWIARGNRTAAWTASAIMVLLIVLNLYKVWQTCLGYGGKAILLAVLVTIIFVHCAFTGVYFIQMAADEE